MKILLRLPDVRALVKEGLPVSFLLSPNSLVITGYQFSMSIHQGLERQPGAGSPDSYFECLCTFFSHICKFWGPPGFCPRGRLSDRNVILHCLAHDFEQAICEIVDILCLDLKRPGKEVL